MGKLTFGSYQQQALSTKIYPVGCTIFYPTLGLVGEAGEVANKIAKHYRDFVIFDKLAPAVADELGDCLWYMAALADDLGLSLEEIAMGNLAKLARRQQEGKLNGEGDER